MRKIILDTSGINVRYNLPLKKKELVLRADVYADPSDASYKGLVQHYKEVDGKEVPITEPNNGIWQNPSIHHTFVVPENYVISEVEDYLKTLFSPDNWATLDAGLASPDFLHLTSSFFKNKAPMTSLPVLTQDTVDLVESTRLSVGEREIVLSDGGDIRVIKPGTITVGASPIDRASYCAAGYTWAYQGDLADGSGTLDTVTVYDSTALENYVFGTLWSDGGTLTVRDSESCGNGSGNQAEVFSGKSITVVATDMAVCYYTAGRMDAATSGGDGLWRQSNEYIDPSDTLPSPSNVAGYIASMQATGNGAAAAYIPKIIMGF